MLLRGDALCCRRLLCAGVGASREAAPGPKPRSLPCTRKCLGCAPVRWAPRWGGRGTAPCVHHAPPPAGSSWHLHLPRVSRSPLHCSLPFPDESSASSSVGQPALCKMEGLRMLEGPRGEQGQRHSGAEGIRGATEVVQQGAGCPMGERGMSLPPRAERGFVCGRASSRRGEVGEGSPAFV